MTSVTKLAAQSYRLWPTLQVQLEACPWHWVLKPWGYVHITGGLTFYFSWLGFTIHFGSTSTPRAARKLKKAA